MSDEYGDKEANIRQLAAMPPDQFSDHLSSLHPHVDGVAPNLTPHIFKTATNAVQFLNSRLPTAGSELLQDKVRKPSRAEKNQWLGLHEIVDNPLKVLSHASNGTLNRHHIEALQAVYPDIHQEIVSKIQEHLGEMKLNGEQIPYAKRLMLSKLTGERLDSTMTQPNMMAIQMAQGGGSPPSGQGNNRNSNRATGVMLRQINSVNEIYPTQSQSREVRKNSAD